MTKSKKRSKETRKRAKIRFETETILFAKEKIHPSVEEKRKTTKMAIKKTRNTRESRGVLEFAGRQMGRLYVFAR